MFTRRAKGPVKEDFGFDKTAPDMHSRFNMWMLLLPGHWYLLSYSFASKAREG
jgi:hypothetical protein